MEPEQIIPLTGVGCELPLAEIYERISFLNHLASRSEDAQACISTATGGSLSGTVGGR